MKIALCNGGLGNQTFQYIFSRFVELEGGEPCYLNDAAFYRNEIAHNGFEILKVFPNAKLRFLSQCFTKDVWQYMVDKGSISQQLKDAGEDYAMIAETADFIFDGNVIPTPTNQFVPWIAQAKGNIYYHGYWINRDWLKSWHWETLRKELQFAPLADDRNKRYEEEIEQTNSVALHVRRGDFLQYGWAASTESYRTAVEVLRAKITGAHFFIFSDDLVWCRENLEAMGLQSEEVTFVEGNTGSNNYLDMQLMSYCKSMSLVSASSFSYLAALLNRNEVISVYNTTNRQV